MEISADTSLVLNIGTLVACGFFLWRLSSSIKKFQTETEIELRLHDEKFDKIEKLDLDNRMTKMQADIDWMRKSQERIEKILENR